MQRESEGERGVLLFAQFGGSYVRFEWVWQKRLAAALTRLQDIR